MERLTLSVGAPAALVPATELQQPKALQRKERQGILSPELTNGESMPTLVGAALDQIWLSQSPSQGQCPQEHTAYEGFKKIAYKQHKLEIDRMNPCGGGKWELAKEKELLTHLSLLADNLKLYEPSLGRFAARLNVLKVNRCEHSFSESMVSYQKTANSHESLRGPLQKSYLDFVLRNADALDQMIAKDRSYQYCDLYSVKLLAAYSLSSKSGECFESIQHSFLRCAIGIARAKAKANGMETSLDEIKLWYDAFSKNQIAPPSPAMANAGILEGAFSTCFTQGSEYKCDIKSELLKSGHGGHGVSLNSETNILQAVRQVEATAKEAVSFRKPVVAYYMSPDHIEFEDFLELKNPLKAEEETVRDGHIAVWTPDLFMKAVSNDGDWYQFPAKQTKHLGELWGDQYEQAYDRLVNEFERGELPGATKIKARKIWDKIVNCQRQSGEPYVLFKDNINRSSNEQHVGPIRLSNLCTEIVQYTAPDTSSICDVLTLSLPSLVSADGSFDFEGLIQLAKIAQNIGDAIADDHHEAKTTKLGNGAKFRSLGLGAQGLTTALQMLKIPYDSKEAIEFNQKVYEHILFGSLEGSVESATRYGQHEHFRNSPAAQGLLQFDLGFDKQVKLSIAVPRWNRLKRDIKEKGLRNSLLTAQQPAVSWSRVFGNSQGAEPVLSNAFLNKDFLGEYWDINREMVLTLKQHGLWDRALVEEILANNGSIQDIQGLPTWIKDLFKTAYDLTADIHLAHSRARAPFIDQSESYSLFLKNPDPTELTSHAMSSWQMGQKTGMYYLKMQAPRSASKNMGLQGVKNTRLPSLGTRQLDAERLGADMEEFTRTMKALHWEKHDLNFMAVPPRFKLLSEEKQRAIKNLLVFFAFGDEWVKNNIGENFESKDWLDFPGDLRTKLTELYKTQDTQETVHDEVYKELLKVTGQDIETVRQMLVKDPHHPVMQKAQFAEKFMAEGTPREERLLAFACLEGIMFSSSFAYLFHLKELDGQLAALIDSNDFIARDESLHKTIAVRILNDPLMQSVNPCRAREIINEAVKIEIGFVDYVLGKDGISGMSRGVMSEYVAYVANGLCRELGFDLLFPDIKQNPLVFMTKQGLDAREDQMSKRSTLYYGDKMQVRYHDVGPRIAEYLRIMVELGVVGSTGTLKFEQGTPPQSEQIWQGGTLFRQKITSPFCGIDGSCSG